MLKNPKFLNNYKNSWLYLGVMFIIFTLILLFVAPKVSAATTYKFNNDFLTITRTNDNGSTSRFLDGKVDSDWTYKQAVADNANVDGQDPCKKMITYEGGMPLQNNGTAYLWDNIWVAGKKSCYFDFTDAHSYKDVINRAGDAYGLGVGDIDLIRDRAKAAGRLKTINIPKASALVARTNFYLDGNSVWSIDYRNRYIQDSTNSNLYFKDGKGCEVDTERVKLYPNFSPGDLKVDGEYDSNPCDDNDDFVEVILGQVTAEVKAAIEAKKARDDAASGGQGDTCESKGEALGWILCPVIELLGSATEWLDGQVQSLLTVPNPLDQTPAIEQAWGRVRNIALIILVPIMLVMVIGTALGLSFIDAYTIKRALPRLLAAVIFISLSWVVLSFMIDVTNVFGRGIQGLITQPFDGPSNSLSALITVGTGGAVSYGGAAVFGALALAGLVSIGIVLSIAFVAVLALAVGFIVLTLRQLLILMLVLLAPIAIIGIIFPNTNALWKMWWSNFSKLLMMFPLIMLLIGSGKAFALVLAATKDGNDAVTQIMIIIAYVAPYFFIFATFKMGGTLFGSLAGAITNSTRGIREGQKKRRAGLRQQGWSDFKSGSGAGRFRQSALVRRVGLGVGAGSKGRLGFGDRGAASTQTNLDNAADEFAQTAAFKANSENDHVLRAAASGLTRAEAIQNMQDVFGYSEAEAAQHVSQAQATIGLGRKQQIASAKQLVMTNTGYVANPNGQGMDAQRQLVSTLARAAGGNASMGQSLAGFANANTKKVGRSDLAPTFTQLNGMVQQEMGQVGSITQDQYGHAQDEALRTQGMGAIIGGKAVAVRNMVPAMRRRIDHAAQGVALAHQTGNQQAIETAERDFKQVLASTAAAVDVASSISPEAATIMADEVLNRQYTNAGGAQIVVSQAIETLRPDDEFGQMRREYSNQLGAQAANAQQQMQLGPQQPGPPRGIPPLPGAP